MLYDVAPISRLPPLFTATQSPPVVDKAVDGEQKKKRKSSSDPLEVIVLGLSHHNAPVDVREKLAIPEDNWNEASTALCGYDSISEAAVLSTCNRFEVYVSGANQYECKSPTPLFLFCLHL